METQKLKCAKKSHYLEIRCKIESVIIPSSDDSTCFDRNDLRQGIGIAEPMAIRPAEKDIKIKVINCYFSSKTFFNSTYH